jgi:hypothetical protein
LTLRHGRRMMSAIARPPNSGDRSNVGTTLVTAGAAALIIAVVGGGASVFGATVPVIPTLRRQAALGLVGLGLLVAGFLVPSDNGGGGASKEVRAYQQRVVAACRDLVQSGGGLPPFNNDGTVDRDRYLEWLREQIATSEGILNALWERPVPDELKDERANARTDSRDLAKKAQVGLNQLKRALPGRFSLIPNPPAVISQANNELATSRASLNGSMSELAGQTCISGQTATSSG